MSANLLRFSVHDGGIGYRRGAGRLLEKRTGTGRIDPQAYIDLNFSAHPAFSIEIVTECILKVSNDPRFWQLHPLPSAAQWEILDGLSRKHQLIFITHRYECDNYSIHQVTCDWLRKHGVSDPVVYFTRSYKSELIGKLKVGLFVDDRHENCQDVAENTNAVVLMPHRPYNQTFSHPGVQRIQDLDELLPFLA